MGKDFNNADKGKSFKKGGDTMAGKMNPGFMAMIAKKKDGAKKMASGGLSGGHKAADGVASKGKTKGKQISMGGNQGLKKGGMAKKYC